MSWRTWPCWVRGGWRSPWPASPWRREGSYPRSLPSPASPASVSACLPHLFPLIYKINLDTLCICQTVMYKSSSRQAVYKYNYIHLPYCEIIRIGGGSILLACLLVHIISKLWISFFTYYTGAPCRKSTIYEYRPSWIQVIPQTIKLQNT